MDGRWPRIKKLVLSKRKAGTGRKIKIPAKTVVKKREAKAAKEAIVPGRK